VDYDSMNKEQLKDEAGKRGLPVSGTVPELVERLQANDNDDLLGDVKPPAPEPAAPAAAAPAAEPPSEPTPPPTSFKAYYDCPGELSTGVHQENVRRCWDDAVAAGYSPRGGAYAAARIGFETRGGKRYAVYEIPLHKAR